VRGVRRVRGLGRERRKVDRIRREVLRIRVLIRVKS